MKSKRGILTGSAVQTRPIECHMRIDNGALSAQTAYAWEASASNDFEYDVPARTSGTQHGDLYKRDICNQPIPSAQISGTQPVSGTVALSALPPPQHQQPHTSSILRPLPTERLLLLVQAVSLFITTVRVHPLHTSNFIIRQPLRQWELTYQK